MPAPRGKHGLMGEAIQSFLSIPNTSKSRKVSLEPSGAVAYMNIQIENGGSLLITDSELQQLFDLIVAGFCMEESYPLSTHYGYWSDEDWGVDPRK